MTNVCVSYDSFIWGFKLHDSFNICPCVLCGMTRAWGSYGSFMCVCMWNDSCVCYDSFISVRMWHDSCVCVDVTPSCVYVCGMTHVCLVYSAICGFMWHDSLCVSYDSFICVTQMEGDAPPKGSTLALAQAAAAAAAAAHRSPGMQCMCVCMCVCVCVHVCVCAAAAAAAAAQHPPGIWCRRMCVVWVGGQVGWEGVGVGIFVFLRGTATAAAAHCHVGSKDCVCVLCGYACACACACARALGARVFLMSTVNAHLWWLRLVGSLEL